MRDAVLTLVVFGLVPICFARPYIGLLTFTWLAYMRPQDLCWGFARTMRYSFFVSLALILGFLINGEGRKLFLNDLRCWLILLLTAISGVSIGFSFTGFDTAVTNYYVEFVKVIFIALITTTLLDTRDRLRWFLWTIALSLGFYGIKTGIWGLLTGGEARVLQGPGGMLEDNNDFALALVMSIPVLFYLGLSEPNKKLASFAHAGALLTMFTVVLTHSRGGFLSMVGVVGMMVWRSKRRIQGLAVAVLVGMIGLAVVPKSFYERLGTLENYEQEDSAASRLRAWKAAFEIVKLYPWLGTGMRNFQIAYARYDPDKNLESIGEDRAIVVHNSYLQVWAENGTPAFAIYLLLLASTFWLLASVRREAARAGARPWVFDFARMFEASLFGFVIGSTFLNRASFDLMYHMIVGSVVFAFLARREMRGEVVWDDEARLAPREASFRPAFGFGRRGSVDPGWVSTAPGASGTGFGLRAGSASAAAGDEPAAPRPGFRGPGEEGLPERLPRWERGGRRPRWFGR